MDEFMDDEQEPKYRKKFKTASVFYEGRLSDGTIFDSNLDSDEPLEILIGRHEVIPGFENALMEMAIGEKREIVVPPGLAYGYREQEAIQRSKTTLIKNGETLKEGMTFKMRTPMSDYPIDGKVLRIVGDFVEIDFNHPLADQDLYFTIELVDLK